MELRILSLIKKSPRINQHELSLQLDVSIPTIKLAMSDMMGKGKLERKRGKRYGHWELKARYMSTSGILVERKLGRFQEIKLLLKGLSSGNRVMEKECG